MGLKFGYDFDIARVYASYEYGFEAKDKIGDTTTKWKNHKFLLNADYTPSIAENLKLVAGGYTGISALKIKGNGVSDSGSDLTLGLRLGAEYSLDASNALEAGFKADRTKYDVDNGGHLTEKNAGFYLGYNYKF